MRVRLLLLVLLLGVVLVRPSRAGYYGPRHDDVPWFDLQSAPHPDDTTSGPPQLASSRIAAVDNGLLLIDSDSGQLVRTDARGVPLARVAIGTGAGTMVYDPSSRRAFVADRWNDRIAVVDVRDRLSITATWPTPAEPYGVALAADGQTLLVTTIADRMLVALDPATGEPRWTAALGPEPRGVAIAPDGSRAIVASLTGAVEIVELDDRRATRRVVLAGQVRRRCEHCADPDADSFARGAYAVRFLGSKTAVVAFQREAPVPMPKHARATSYGGSHLNITRHVAYLSLDGGSPRQAVAQIAIAEPRAIAWDSVHDRMYVVGTGADRVLRIDHASRRDASASVFSNAIAFPRDAAPCGADGLAIMPGGDLAVWCSLSRQVATVHFKAPPVWTTSWYDVTIGPALSPTRLTPQEHDGMVLFHRVDPAISERDRMACATCHLDGRSDGLSWRIDGHDLQTPVLAGRIADTAPYKWTGRDADLLASIHATIQRLGGRGLDDHQTAALAAYVTALPRVRPPTGDAAAIERGRVVFDAVGCASCHAGPATTDGMQHRFGGSTFDVDTPSLHGLAASAPYLHDGSAKTLDGLLRGEGSIRGMVLRDLTAAERRDLIAFLDSL
jgi:sugar lactone lactonase YvrE